jgi:hypothetical protein
MPARKRAAASPDTARLKVLAASDERAFLRAALEMLGGGRLQREAALAALAERPLPAAREALRAVYFELDADGLKRDQGGAMRVNIVRALAGIRDVRDRDIALRALDAHETAFGEDITWQLRVHGLSLLAEVAPDVFPFYAAEHLDDASGLDGEPAHTAFRLLAATENYLPLYQWLYASDADSSYVARVFELFSPGPPELVRRYVSSALAGAVRRQDEALCTVLAEAVVNLELEAAYDSLGGLMSSKVSDALYEYLAVLLAGTNRRPLLAILEEQLRHGRRARAVLAALRVRTTPEQQAIIDRYERDDDAG